MPVNSFESYPMSWKPVLDKTKKPLYQQLANLLKNDLAQGILHPGTKLPPQRELADYLDINLSTVTRAFKLLEAEGILCSAVGNGTYISSDATSGGMLVLNPPETGIIEMGAILPDSLSNETVVDTLKEMLAQPDSYLFFDYGNIDCIGFELEAAKIWFSLCHLNLEKEEIACAVGGQNALFATLSALFHAGDRIATLPLTYPGVKVCAKTLGIEIVPLRFENEKITHESLMYAYKNQNIKGLYLNSDYCNPTGETLDLETRQTIGAFCEEVSIPIIEDGINTLFYNDPPMPICGYTPNHGIYISSVSKVLAPGLRLALLQLPQQYASAVKNSLYSINITIPPLMLKLFTKLVLSGNYKEIIANRIAHIQKRNELYADILGDYDTIKDKNCPIRWLTLPNHLNADTFEELALKHHLQVYAANRFSVGNAVPPNCIRLSIVSERNMERYTRGLYILRELLGS